ncbi:hypothetical protein [Planktomarina sp.]|uniref:hypothetical protein n=1 Tax=Planktomarina sp. TaxID=2024851 RepID=UPI00326177C5
MSALIEVKYFNSFILKKVLDDVDFIAMWPGLPWSPYSAVFAPPITPATITWPSNNKPTTTGSLQTASTSTGYMWYLEESRIRGGYNNTEAGYGVRAYITEENDDEIVSSNSLTYSGIYNALTDFNETNVFSIGENITKSVDPTYGSIQRIYTNDGNLMVFQEDKVSRALINKSAIYSAQGDATVTSSDLVIGQVTPYAGEYGISKNPESFAKKGYRIYWADQSRGAVLRLSRDGITEISEYGMRDHFRDTFSPITSNYKLSDLLSFTVSGTGVTIGLTGDVSLIELGMSIYGNYGGATGAYVTDISVTGATTADITFSQSIAAGTGTLNLYKLVKDKVVGGFDNYADAYVVSIQPSVNDLSAGDGTYDTVSFNDSNNGWNSFWDYKPNLADTLNANYYTCKGGSIWRHYDASMAKNRGQFYGVQTDTSVTFVFNPQVSVSKNFNTVSYEGMNGWEVESFKSDTQGIDLNNYSGPPSLNDYQDVTSNVYSYDEGSYTEGGVTYRAGFDRKEGKYVSNLINNSTARIDEVIYGVDMSGIKGYYATVKVKTDATTDVGGLKQIFAVSTNNVFSS